MSSRADDFRRLAENAKARAEGKDEICRGVLMSVGDAYALMARVQEDFDRPIMQYASRP